MRMGSSLPTTSPGTASTRRPAAFRGEWGKPTTPGARQPTSHCKGQDTQVGCHVFDYASDAPPLIERFSTICSGNGGGACFLAESLSGTPNRQVQRGRLGPHVTPALKRFAPFSEVMGLFSFVEVQVISWMRVEVLQRLGKKLFSTSGQPLQLFTLFLRRLRQRDRGLQPHLLYGHHPCANLLRRLRRAPRATPMRGGGEVMGPRSSSGPNRLERMWRLHLRRPVLGPP